MAAGSLPADTQNSVTQGFGGDGRRARLTENNVTTYFVTSSALGGQVVTEVTQQGGAWQKARGYVYAGEERVAKQEAGRRLAHPPNPDGTRGTPWGGT